MCNKEQGYYEGQHTQDAASTPEAQTAPVEKRESSKKADKQPEKVVEQGMCLWTDGSCIPNPGFGGWGLHGYLFGFELPKKGSGNPDHILTAEGYLMKTDPEVVKGKAKAVTPLHYVDGFGSYEIDMARNLKVSNNIAELDAAYHGLKHAENYAIKSVRIYTDSEYVRKGMESWVTSWKKYGWKRSDGSEITNLMNWRRLSDQADMLRAKGIEVVFEWVRSHSDILGNVKADRWAMVGTVHSLAGRVKNEVVTSQADGYWGYESLKHPFISHQSLYFNTRRSHLTPGEYYLGYHGKEDDEFGQRSADGAFAVIRMNTPDPVIEELIAYSAELADNTDNLMKMIIGNVFNATVHRELNAHGRLATHRSNAYRLDLVGADDEPLTTQFRPAKLAYRAVENIGFLGEKLDLYLNNPDALGITDLTPILYETLVKTGKKDTTTQTVLKDTYSVGFAALDVMANYKPDAATGELHQESLRLTLGIDMLDRNGLRRLEKMNPKVHLITWMESELGFRHATVIHCDGGVGIWAGMYSNFRVLSDKASTPVAVEAVA